MTSLLTILALGGGLVLAAYFLGRNRVHRKKTEEELRAVDEAKEDRELLNDPEKRKTLEDHYR